MIIPVSTDAPVYHWPFATVGLIVANVLLAVFALVAVVNGDFAFVEAFLLHHGRGLRPWEWVTSMFMHDGILHLAGNMLFLWIFGLVVEGKVGWWRFLLIYLGVGVLQSAIEQLLWLGFSGESVSLGASSAIYGIMAISVIWAPQNNINVFYWFAFVFYGTVDIAISMFATIYVAFDLLEVLLSPQLMSTGFLHISGLLIGLPVGVVMLKKGWVDCEGWDIFRSMQSEKKKEAVAAQRDRRVAERKKLQTEAEVQTLQRSFDDLLAQGHPEAALRVWGKLVALTPPAQMEHQQLKMLVTQLHQQQLYAESAPFMSEWIERFPESSDAVRLKLAQICVTVFERPALAIELLGVIDFKRQKPESIALAKKVLGRARRMQADGVVELENAGW